MDELKAAFARRIAHNRAKQEQEDAFAESAYNRWEVAEMIVREIEALAEECGLRT